MITIKLFMKLMKTFIQFLFSEKFRNFLCIFISNLKTSINDFIEESKLDSLEHLKFNLKSLFCIIKFFFKSFEVIKKKAEKTELNPWLVFFVSAIDQVLFWLFFTSIPIRIVIWFWSNFTFEDLIGFILFPITSIQMHSEKLMSFFLFNLCLFFK